MVERFSNKFHCVASQSDFDQLRSDFKEQMRKVKPLLGRISKRDLGQLEELLKQRADFEEKAKQRLDSPDDQAVGICFHSK